MNVGIIGIRGYGGSYFKALRGRPDARVTALCDTDTESAARLAAENSVPAWFADYRELVAQPGLDAVFIATPHFLHHPMAMEALRAGRHVFCEKPLAIRSDHAEEMVRAARERGLILSCHYNQRQTDYVRTLRRVVADGLLGDVYHVNVRWMARWTRFMFDARTSWRLQPEKSGGGIFIGRGSHLIDAVRFILGGPPVRSVLACAHPRLTGAPVDDFASALLRFDGGLTVNVQCSYVAHAAAFGDRMEYEIYGSQAGASCLRGDSAEAGLRVGRCRMEDGSWEDLADRIDREAIARDRPASVIHDFLDAVAAGTEPCVTGEDAAHIVHVMNAGYESSRTGREVEVRQPGERS